MAVRTRYKVSCKISSSADTENGDLGNLSYDVVDDLQGEGGTHKFTLVSLASDVQIFLGNVAVATMLMIRTNAKDPNDDPVAITVKRETVGGEAIIIQPVGNTKEGHFLLTTDSLTALYGSNPGAVDMELTIGVVGD